MGQIILYNAIKINRGIDMPVYLQVTNAIIKEIQLGRLRPGTKMMGVKALATLLGLNKNTIERIYDELQLQQWVSRIPRKGTFVSEKLPETHPQQWNRQPQLKKVANEFEAVDSLSVANKTPPNTLRFDDGFPDARVVDYLSIGRMHRSIFRTKQYQHLFSYTTPYGSDFLRKELVKYLNDTRGIHCNEENILITRGSQMAIFLGMKAYLGEGGKAIMGSPGYFGAQNTLKYLGAEILAVSVDGEGLNIDEITEHCKKHHIRLVYITPHHQHPTTVTLSPTRRMNLLRLAETHGFVILEDDYDYDYHYGNAPILPLSSIDSLQRTIYTGSFSKVLAPALRIGYLLAPKKIIDRAAQIRRVIDHQGDPIMEHAMAMLLKQGEINRVLRRSRKLYQQRRDYFCEQLGQHFSHHIAFKNPEGGLAVWASFDPAIDIMELSKKALASKLHLPTANHYAPSINAMRLGFASMNFSEIDKALQLLKSALI